MQFLIVLLSRAEVRAAAAILRALPSSISLSSAQEVVFFPEMVLCPEVLALIVATALLSRHRGMQREREIRAAGEH